MRLDFAYKFAIGFLFVSALTLMLPHLLKGYGGVPSPYAEFVTLALALIAGFFLSRSITQNVRNLRECTTRISRGDLTDSVHVEGGRYFPDETVDLARSLNEMLESVRDLVAHIQRAADDVKTSSEELSRSSQGVKQTSQEIAQTMQTVSLGAERQQEDVSHSAAHVHAMAEAVRENADQAREAFRIAEDTHQRSTTGVDLSRLTVAQMEALFERIDEAGRQVITLEGKIRAVNRIAEVITSVAEKTHLLSLNASIEAARAGDAGRGFSAVADEIRKLAESAGDQAEQIAEIVCQLEDESGRISTLMEKMGEEVRGGREDLDSILTALEQIQSASREVSNRTGAIFENAEDQASETRKMAEDIESITEVAKQNASATEGMRRTLAAQAEGMDGVVNQAVRLFEMSVRLGDVSGRFRTR